MSVAHDIDNEVDVAGSIQQIHVRIRQFRKQKGLTMGELAELAGTSQQQIDRLEKGKRRLTLEWLIKLCQAFECDLNDFLPNMTSGADTKTSEVNVVGALGAHGDISWLPVIDNYSLTLSSHVFPADTPLFGVVVTDENHPQFPLNTELVFAKISPENTAWQQAKAVLFEEHGSYVMRPATPDDTTPYGYLVRLITSG